MDTPTLEQALRRDAIRRRVQGERRCAICGDLPRSPAWFGQWWAEYRRHPRLDFADRSRAPHPSPTQTPPVVEPAVIAIRQALEAGQTAQTRDGLIGHRAIRWELERLGVTPLPAVATLQRILARHGLPPRLGATTDRAYYPGPLAWEPNASHATDLITRPLYGGQAVQNIHSFAPDTHTVHLSQPSDKTSATVRAHLLQVWSRLGIPVRQQFDHEASFGGGHSPRRVIGQVVRLCLFVGVEGLFIPAHAAQRNHWVEGFHARWVRAFWSRTRCRHLVEVQAEAPTFRRWYHWRSRPPSLADKTPMPMRRGFQAVRLTAGLQRLIPQRLPLSRGRVHFIRKVDMMGTVHLLNETWLIGRPWIGE